MRITIDFEGTQPPGQVTLSPSDSAQVSGSTQPSTANATNAGPAPSATGEAATTTGDNPYPEVNASVMAQPGDHSAGAAPQVSGT